MNKVDLREAADSIAWAGEILERHQPQIGRGVVAPLAHGPVPAAVYAGLTVSRAGAFRSAICGGDGSENPRVAT